MDLNHYARETGELLRSKLERIANDSMTTEDQARVDEALNESVERFAAARVLGRDNLTPSTAFWSVVGDLLTLGNMHHLAHDKPRGYAGDFELLYKIHTNYRCEDRLGRAFDSYFQKQAAPQAVRNRYRLVGDAIARRVRENSQEVVRIVSVGSGPAADIEHAVKQLDDSARERMHIVLIDIDPDALTFCQERLKAWLQPEQITCARENLFRIGRNAHSRALLEGADMIVCVGLFDYLEANVAASHMGVFWRALSRGGTVTVLNFVPDNPSRTYMEWLGNWYLIYRTRDELYSIGSEAGLPSDNVHVGAEPEGINLFLTATKG